MNTWDKCKNCGGERGLHHFETDQCPFGGREAPISRKQEWKSTTFEIEIETEKLDLEKVALKAMLKYIEFEVVSKCCPVCGGNQCHDSACVLAAFLYPEKAESYKYNTKDTHINEMLWQIGNDERFAFLRDELSVAKSAG